MATNEEYSKRKPFLTAKSDFISDVDDDADSAKMLRHLELIDGEASEYGVRIVKLDDALMAKKYGHRDPVGALLRNEE